MKNDLLYENLVTAIKDKFPGRGVLTNKLADLLMLEKEAVYRRLRGDVPFTIFELLPLLPSWIFRWIISLAVLRVRAGRSR